MRSHKTMIAALLLALTATQARANFTITLTTSGPSSPAVVVSSPAGINCGGANTSCVASFAQQSTVTLSEAPSSTMVFAGWGGEGGCRTNLLACLVPMTSSRTVTASFNPALAMRLAGNGAGVIKDSSGTVRCSLYNGCASGATVTQSYSPGTSVVLTASATAPSTFVGWGGDCAGAGTCSLTMSKSKVVIATFTSSGLFTIVVERIGTGTGTVTSSPYGIVCGTTCAASFAAGVSVVFTATAIAPSRFVGWANAGCASTGMCVVTSTSAQQGLGGSQSPAAFFYRP